ncbi:MAG TPA: FAD-dependent oxidoreductase [Fimbriimonadaceae bacterium]|nr:FAD-dependent oxidoreductase [Fimbriimonadaceae bacterium]
MPEPEPILNGAPKIGVYVCHCGINIASKVDVKAVVEFAATLPFVSVAKEYKFMCSDPGQDMIKEDIRAGKVNRVVVASCSPLMHEVTFRRAIKDAGENPFLFQMANIREHVSWVTSDGADATEKAKSHISAAVRRVALHDSLDRKRVEVRRDVLVVGAGIAGIQAALQIADSGKKVYLVEREPTIGGHMAQFDKTFPTLDCAACILTPKMTQVRAHPNIELLTYSEIESVDGFVGNFDVKIRRKARYVREDLCTGCDECTSVCPVHLPSEFDEGMSQRKAIYRAFPQAVPNVFTISRKGAPPCQAGCSIHQNAQGYVTLIGQGEFKEALDVILRDNPLPSICGRVCTHPCTEHCTRAKVDDPLNIPGLKRFVTDRFPDYEIPKPAKERPETVAVVGAGPAGLMCAHELRQRGFKPVIYEASSVPGGMLTLGIPAFRLPRTVIGQEIKRLEATGIEIKLNSPIGKETTLEDLRKRHAAVFLGIGAHQERKLGIEGESLPNIWGGIEFLRKVNLEGPFSIGKRVVVIGGGNSALDAARTALRCGAEKVTIAYRRTRTEMPADPEEVEDTETEGVELLLLTAPKAIQGSPEKGVTALECFKMKLGAADASGRAAPEIIPGSDFRIDCDAVIATIGQIPDIASLGDKLGLDTTRWNTFEADQTTLETNIPGVFVGGDCVTGPDVVVNAMYAGKKAAISIERYLDGKNTHAGRESEAPFVPTYSVDTSGAVFHHKVPLPSIPLTSRKSFEEVRTGYTEAMAVEEAKRCLDCGVCCDCQLCATVCEPKAIDYSMHDEIRKLEVGAIILATGFKTFDAKRIPRYGYGKYPNVYTSLEVERMVNASGPFNGEVRLKDGSAPKRVAIVHCVGSRDENTNRYCSRVCCMYSMKLAHLIQERTGAEIFNFYIDIRAAGKGYEEFYERVQQEGVQFIRGRVAEVSDWAMSPDEEGKLVVRAEDTLLGVVRRIPVDMVVLSVGMEPQADVEEVRRKFNISCGTGGFFLERHPKLGPVSTFVDGISIAGACQSPKDIPDTVAQASAAAAEAMTLIDAGFVETEPFVTWIDDQACKGCKTCIDVCPYSAIFYDDVRHVAVVNEALCRGCGLCAMECPAHIPATKQYEDRQILAELTGALR